MHKSIIMSSKNEVPRKEIFQNEPAGSLFFYLLTLLIFSRLASFPKQKTLTKFINKGYVYMGGSVFALKDVPGRGERPTVRHIAVFVYYSKFFDLQWMNKLM